MDQQYDSIPELNLKYLKRLNDKIERILFTCKFSSLSELDQCAGIWHQAEFQGPWFLVECREKQYQIILLNQNSRNDFMRVIQSDMKMEIVKKNQKENYFFFKDTNQKVFSLPIAEYSEIQELILTLEHIFPKIKLNHSS